MSAFFEWSGRMIEGVLFDLDGTLIDYEGESNVALNYAFKGHPGDCDWALHRRIVGMRSEDWARIILEANGLTESLPAADYIAGYYEHIEAHFSTLPLMPGAREVLELVAAAGIPIAIATSSDRSACEKKMAAHPELAKHVCVTVTGDDPELERGKPAPDIFLLAARRLGVSPTRCVVFEDSPAGVQAGIGAGAVVVHLPDPRIFPPGTLQSEAHIVLNSLTAFTLEMARAELSHRQRVTEVSLHCTPQF